VMTAVGGDNQSVTVEGRERYGINVRYARDYRDDLQSLRRVLLPLPMGKGQIPMEEIADVVLTHGPSMIRDENGLLAGYVYVDFDTSKIDVGHYVDQAKRAVAASVTVPTGYSMSWSGQYENMLRVKERLKLILPLTLVLIFALLYKYEVRLQGQRRDASSAVLLGRRGLVVVGARLQRVDRRLGRADRAHGLGRRNGRLHAAISGSVARGIQEEGAAEHGE
jgi:AcrB/AcrD/AcrF family